MDLTPKEAGHHTHTFQSVSDSVYTERLLRDLVLSQSVSATFADVRRPQQAYIDDAVEFEIELSGESVTVQCFTTSIDNLMMLLFTMCIESPTQLVAIEQA
jgi:hypothetical protein